MGGGGDISIVDGQARTQELSQGGQVFFAPPPGPKNAVILYEVYYMSPRWPILYSRTLYYNVSLCLVLYYSLKS